MLAKFSVGCSASIADCLCLTGCATSVAILGVLDVVTAAYGTLMEVLTVLARPVEGHIVFACLVARVPLIGRICIVLCARAATGAIVPIGIAFLTVRRRRSYGVIHLLGVVMSESFYQHITAFGTNLIGRTACRRTARVVGYCDNNVFCNAIVICRVGRSERHRYCDIAHLSERCLACKAPSGRKCDIIRSLAYADGEVCRLARCIVGSKVACRLTEGYGAFHGYRFVKVGRRRRNGIAYLSCARCGNNTAFIDRCVTAYDRIGKCALVAANAYLIFLFPSRGIRRSRYGQCLRSLVQHNREGLGCRIVVVGCRLGYGQGKGAACLCDIRHNAVCKVEGYAVLCGCRIGERSVACAAHVVSEVNRQALRVGKFILGKSDGLVGFADINFYDGIRCRRFIVQSCFYNAEIII